MGFEKKAQHFCVETFLQKTVKLLILVVVCESLLGGMNKTMSSPYTDHSCFLHTNCRKPKKLKEDFSRM